MDNENGEISIQEVKIYLALKKNQKNYLTNNELGKILEDVAVRTIRLHTMRFCKLGIIDKIEVYPGHRFKLSDKAEKRNQSYILRLKSAEQAMKGLLKK